MKKTFVMQVAQTARNLMDLSIISRMKDCSAHRYYDRLHTHFNAGTVLRSFRRVNMQLPRSLFFIQGVTRQSMGWGYCMVLTSTPKYVRIFGCRKFDHRTHSIATRRY